MKSLQDYLDLITSEFKDQPLFTAVVGATSQAAVDLATLLTGMPGAFDLDAAVGSQLDAVGEWVGISRNVAVPLTGVYFSWNDTAVDGWNSGTWRGQFDPMTGLTSLPDDAYRVLLKAKIAANHWDGSIPGAYAVWAIAFGGSQVILLQDNQDMSMTIGFVGAPLPAVQQALLQGGYIPLRPVGVKINFYAVPVNSGPLFAWNIQNSNLAGWGSGSWAKQVYPT